MWDRRRKFICVKKKGRSKVERGLWDSRKNLFLSEMGGEKEKFRASPKRERNTTRRSKKSSANHRGRVRSEEKEGGQKVDLQNAR